MESPLLPPRLQEGPGSHTSTELRLCGLTLLQSSLSGLQRSQRGCPPSNPAISGRSLIYLHLALPQHHSRKRKSSPCRHPPQNGRWAPSTQGTFSGLKAVDGQGLKRHRRFSGTSSAKWASPSPISRRERESAEACLMLLPGERLKRHLRKK